MAERAPSVETWPYTSPVTATDECPSSCSTWLGLRSASGLHAIFVREDLRTQQLAYVTLVAGSPGIGDLLRAVAYQGEVP